MSGSKHFDKVAWVCTALLLVVTILFMNGAALGIEAMEHTMGYENRLFDNTRVHTIDIVMDDWDSFIATATSEEYSPVHVVIDGEAYKNVGIRGKGNTSLSTVSSMNSQRYSFKIEFDQYDSSITYHGLDKLSLNNLIQDTTMMKDYLTYTMMNQFGVDAPLCSFVYITVNGEDWGLYLAVEGVEDAFLTRNYGSDYGELYKPDSMSFGGGRGNGKDFDMSEFMNQNETVENPDDTASGIPQMPDMGGFDPSAIFGGDMGGFDPSAMFGSDMSDFATSSIPGDGATMFGSGEMPTGTEENGEGRPSRDFGGMGGFGMGSSDVKLQYIDDNPDSYANIWNNAKTDITATDQTRLIESLKKLSAGEEIESVVAIEEVIRYFVVHNYICNGDSYTGSMIHNYYLYEENGQISMIPWDYNLAFGTFQGGMAQSTVNTPIDTPISGGAGSDRPMWSWIVANEEYTQLYHQYFMEFLNTVDIAGIIEDAYTLIKPYVEKDPTKFYTYEEFETGVETMRQFCTLRTESITAQLANGETTETMDYADASNLNLSDMGSMSGMGGGGFGGGMPEGFDASQMPGGFGGSMPEGLDMSQMSDGFGGDMPEGLDGSQMSGQSGDTAAGDTETTTENVRPSRDNRQMPGGEVSFGMSGMNTGTSTAAGWIWMGGSVLILCVGLVVARKYRY